VPGYRFVVDDVAGAWVMLSRLLDVGRGVGTPAAALHELSASWRGDRFWIYESEDGARDAAVVWSIDWVDAAATSRFSELVNLAVPGAGVQVQAQGTTTHVVVVERLADAAAWLERAGDALPQ